MPNLALISVVLTFGRYILMRLYFHTRRPYFFTLILTVSKLVLLL